MVGRRVRGRTKLWWLGAVLCLGCAAMAQDAKTPGFALSVADLCGPGISAGVIQLLESGKLPQAEAELQALAETRPGDGRIRNAEGVAFLLERRLPEAQDAFQKALQLDSEFVIARRNLGITFWHEHQLEPARETLRAALEREPNDRLGNLYFGQIAFAGHDCHAAFEYFSRSKEALASVPVATFMDAVCSLQLGNPDTAKSLLQRIRPGAEIPTRSLFDFAIEANRQRQYSLSLTAMKLLPPDYPDSYTHGYDEALAAYESGESAEAAGLLQNLISRGFATAELYNLLGNALETEGIRDKQPEVVKKAYQAYREGIYRNSHDLANFIDISRLALTLGNYELCEQLLTEGLTQNPRSYELMIERGIAYALSSKESEAASDFEAARNVAPANPIPYVVMGMLAIQEGRNADAVQVLQQGIDRSQNPNAWLYFLLARSLYKEGLDTPEAEMRIREALTQAMRLDPTLTEAFALAGHVSLKSGDIKQALQYLETAHRLDPSNSHYMYVLASARRMQGDRRGAASDLQAFRELEAANNPARMREFFIRMSATPASDPAFRALTNSR